MKGLCIFFTGLSGSGKSTLTDILKNWYTLRGRSVTTLDGDEVRTHLSKGLGFSREDRDTNVKRIGWVAAEVVKHGGIAICSVIAPYQEARDYCRSLVPVGRFVEVYVSAPLWLCEERDVKGLYAKARRENTPHFTGLSDPYEVPVAPEIVVHTDVSSPHESAYRIITYITNIR